MQLSRFLSAASIIMALLSHEVVLSQSMGAPPEMTKKKETQSAKKDPLLTGAFAPIPMDDETKDALKRSQAPGVLLAREFSKGVVSKISIEGAKKVEPDAMITQLKSHINRVFDKNLIKEDIKRLYAVGVFSEISVIRNDGPEGSIELVYQLKEKPTLFKVKFKGNEELSEKELRDAVTLDRFHVADNFRIKENAEKIRKLYAEKGFFLVTVTYHLEDVKEYELDEKDDQGSRDTDSGKTVKINTPRVVAPDFRNVVYVIDEGNKIRIENISISGNKKFSSEELKNVVFSRENHPFGTLTNWGTFNEEMSDADALVLEQYYMDHGYLNVVVGKPRIGISEDKTRFSIHIPVSEGEQFFIGKLDVKGDFVVDKIDTSKFEEPNATPQFERERLLNYLSAKPKDVFNRSQVGKEVQGLIETYRDMGYAYANIYPKMDPHDVDRTVDVTLTIDAGPRVNIERIDISGNHKTASEVIRRELRVYEGERFSSSMLKLSEIRLNQLGYFEKVKIANKEGSSPDQMVIEVEVEERKTGSFSVGGGFGTGGEGLLFQSQITQNNLFGRGQTLTGTVQWSGFRRIFDIRFVDPYLTYLGNEPLTFSMSAFNTDRFMGDFKRKSSGGDLTFGYPVGHPLFGLSQKWMRNASPWLLPFVPDFENLRLFMTYGVERVAIGDVVSGVSLLGLHPLQPRYTTSLKPTLQLDQRNDRMFPSAGYLLELRSEFSSYALGSGLLKVLENSFATDADKRGIRGGLWYLTPEAATNNYFRFSTNARFYFNFDRWLPISGFVFRLNLDLAIIKTFEDQLFSENYRMGGVGVGNVTGLRGYVYQSVGPTIPVGRDRENQILHQFVLGGNKQALLNVELEIPLIKSMKLTGVLFFDLGNVYAPDENFFYAGGTRNPYYTSNLSDPLGTFYGLGLYSSVGFGFRWFSPMAPIRVEFGFPLVRRPAGTPGIPTGDRYYQFEFNIGQSF